MNLKWLYRLLAVWDCRPMPAELSAVWGAFLHEGLMCHPGDPGRTRRILETWDSGCIELIIASCEYLDPLWQTVSHVWFEPRGRPGIFEYEVVSELGEWLGEQLLTHGHLPSNIEAERYIEALVNDFFEIGEEGPSSSSRAA